MDDLSRKFIELFGSGIPAQRFFCPGRVNLIGEHIDYLGGRVMPAAISLGITALVRDNGSNSINAFSTDFEGTVSFQLDELPESKQNHWSDFLLGVILHLQKEGTQLSGYDILFASDLPKASGLSSSAALEVLCYFVLSKTVVDKVQMAVDCQLIENEFIGVSCGIMDQFAVANGKRDHALLLNCKTLEHELIPLQTGNYSILIVNSNKPRTLAESAYNQRRKECDEALKIIQQYRPISNLVEATSDDLQFIHDTTIRKRTQHALTEQFRVEESAKQLKSGNLEAFGKLMTASHISLRDDHEVSCSELDFIVDALNDHESCLGARMTGAGFGGCCVSLVRSENIQSISEKIEKDYSLQFGHAPSFYKCIPSNGVHLIT